MKLIIIRVQVCMLSFSISLEDDPKLKDQTKENAEYVVKAIFTGIENDTA